MGYCISCSSISNLGRNEFQNYSKTSSNNHPENTSNQLLRAIFLEGNFSFFIINYNEPGNMSNQLYIPELQPPFSITNEFEKISTSLTLVL